MHDGTENLITLLLLCAQDKIAKNHYKILKDKIVVCIYLNPHSLLYIFIIINIKIYVINLKKQTILENTNKIKEFYPNIKHLLK